MKTKSRKTGNKKWFEIEELKTFKAEQISKEFICLTFHLDGRYKVNKDIIAKIEEKFGTVYAPVCVQSRNNRFSYSFPRHIYIEREEAHKAAKYIQRLLKGAVR